MISLKKQIYLIFLLIIALSAQGVCAQQVVGIVYSEENGDGENKPLVGATVHFSDKGRIINGVSTDAQGRFSLNVGKNVGGYIHAGYLGYQSDSVLLDTDDLFVELILRPLSIISDDIVVEGAMPGTVFSKITTQKTEMITSAGLMKLACCNLSESFENSATVTVGFTDAVTGAKQVQMLGLAGVYNQMLSENIPIMRGLAATYGWSYIPGPWLESIQISKGTSSVVNGYESLSGQMNLEFKKPNNTEDLFINIYGDEASRFEANITSAIKINDKLWSGLLLHGSVEDKVHDRDDDGFMDSPKTKFVNVYNRWFYLNPEKGVESRTGFKFLHDTRQGGQYSSPDSQPLFTTDIVNTNFTVYNKTGFATGRIEGESIGIITSYSHHDQRSDIGMKSYDGYQDSFYANLLFSSSIYGDEHKYTVGASFSYDSYKTNFEDKLPTNQTGLVKLDRQEAVPGVFAQYTWSPNESLTLLAGSRVDYNSEYGWLVTPRFNVKYGLFSDAIILRASAGRGFRSANIFAENIGLMASSKNLETSGISKLGIEDAWNFGGNATFYIPVWSGRNMTLSLDYFHTRFANQVVVDIEREKGKVYFYDLSGKSYADAFQADLSVTIAKGLDFLTAFRYNISKVTYGDGVKSVSKEKPLVSKYRGLVNVSYATALKKWVFDATAQLNGPSRLPADGYDSSDTFSPIYAVYYLQVTKNTRRFDIYAGIENILDYRQKNAVIAPDDPFGPLFDSSIVWGPLMGRKVYAGIRLRIGKF